MRNGMRIIKVSLYRRGLATSSLQKTATSSVSEKTEKYLADKEKVKPEISIWESCQQWFQLLTNPKENLILKQDTLLHMAFPGYYQSQVGDMKATSNRIPIDSNGNYVNEIKIENGEAPLVESLELTRNLVMVHGYASAAGLFYKNFHDVIASQPNSRIFSLDLLGFGLSSKKPFQSVVNQSGSREFPISLDTNKLTPAKQIHASLKLPDQFQMSIEDLKDYNIKNQHDIIEEVEDYYIDALEAWRIENKLENFTLFGHSLGGYLSIAYALKYPERVEKLVLVSPGGVERSPFAITNPIFKELDTVKEEQIVLKPTVTPDSYNFLGRYPILSDVYKRLWINELAPTRILRLAGPWSYSLFFHDWFRKLSRNLKNFKHPNELKIVIDYLYSAVMVKSTLDYLIMKLFASSVVGKYPMFDRIQDLKAKKIIWLFGEFDFMFNSIGDVSTKKLTNLGIDSSFKIISKSGHNLYFDNANEFNTELKKFLNWK